MALKAYSLPAFMRWQHAVEVSGRLSKEVFQRRVTPNGVAFYTDGSAAIYCDDKEPFLRHTIEIMVVENGKYCPVHLAGQRCCGYREPADAVRRVVDAVEQTHQVPCAYWL